jgi:hypothetical protein
MTYLNEIVNSHRKTEKTFWQQERFDVSHVNRGAHIEKL